MQDLAKAVEQHNKQSSAVHLNQITEIAKKILSGETNIYEFARKNKGTIKIKEVIDRASLEDRKKIQQIVLEAMGSGRLNMKDYVRLF